MSEPTLETVAPRGVVDVSNSPSALDETTFDSLFPANPPSPASQPTTAVPQTQGTTPATQPTSTPSTTPQQPNAPFLKGIKSTYNSAEAAIQGINEKDTLIDTLRTRYALTTGIDPITGQPVTANAQPVPVDNYSDNPTKYLEDLYSAAKSGGPEAYRNVQQKFIMDTLKPIQPLIQETAKNRAVQELSTEIKDAGTYIGSPNYTKALEANPELAMAIQAAESDFRWHSRLPGLYKIAYLAGQGLQLPELLKANQPNSTTPVSRPTTAQPTTMAPPSTTAAPSLRTLDGIKAVIADGIARGIKLEF